MIGCAETSSVAPDIISTSPRPRVLYLVTRGERGGAQAHVLHLATTMKSHFEVVVATGERGFLVDECISRGIPVHIVHNLQRDINFLSDTLSFLQIVWLLRKVRPDIVHAHTFKAGLIGRFAAARLGIPSIYTVHMWPFELSDSPSSWRLFGPPIERLSATWCDRIIAVSSTGAEIGERHGIGQRQKITWIHNGIPDCEERASVDSTGPPVITMVARFTEPKYQELLLRAFAKIPAGPILRLVGDGPKRAEAERLAKDLGIADRTVFMGSRSDIPELLASSQIFVLASRSELFPISILEAMRAGLPIVASNVGGVPEAVINNHSGLLVPTESVNAMAQAIEKLLSDRELRIRLGRAARLRFEEHFSSTRMAIRTRSIYFDVLRQRSALTLPRAESQPVA